MPVLVLVATIALALLILLWTLMRWSMGHGARVMLRGVGLLLVVVGLYLAGVATLAGNGVRSLVDWARRTTLTNTMLIGLAVAGAGLLAWLVGSLLRPHSRERAREVRQARKGLPATGAATSSAVPGTAPAAARPVASKSVASKSVASKSAASKSVASKGAPALDDEDAEIAELLSRRGIN